jgi:hypothetical protein
LDKRKGRRSGEQEIRVQSIRTAGYQVKEKSWQGIGLPALLANVMVCGYFKRLFLSELAYWARAAIS